MGWIASLLLESPVPPPRWLPSGNERRAQAHAIVRRVLDRRASHHHWHPGHYLHDLGSAYPMFGGSRFVSGEAIEEELENELTHLNPPVFQGWGCAFIVAFAIGVLFVIRDLAYPEDARFLGTAVLACLATVAIWITIRAGIGRLEHELELCQHGVAVRRWIDVWLHRPGHVLDDPALLEGSIDGDTLRLVGPAGSASVSLRIWPETAREDLRSELEAWGITFGHRHDEHHHPRRRHART